MLDHPTQYGVDWSDPEKSQGGIWVDGLHPTAKVQAVLAEAVQDFLRSV